MRRPVDWQLPARGRLLCYDFQEKAFILHEQERNFTPVRDLRIEDTEELATELLGKLGLLVVGNSCWLLSRPRIL
jgi:hypothetical protein